MVEGERVVGEADEDQPGRLLQRQTAQAVTGGVEVGRHVPRGGEAAVEMVGPGVVGADEVAGVALRLGADLGAAVAADVEQGVQRTACVAGDDHLLRIHAHHEIVAGGGRLADMAGAEPVAMPDPRLLMRKHRRIVVEAARQRRAGPVRFEQRLHRHRGCRGGGSGGRCRKVVGCGHLPSSVCCTRA